MDPESLVLGALAAGAGAGLKDSASDAVRATYREFLSRINGLMHRNADDAAPETPASLDSLREQLSTLSAAEEAVLIELARKVKSYAEEGVGSRTIVTTVHDSQGVQIGDGNTQVNRFDA